MAVVTPLEEEQMEPELREFVQFFKGPLGVIPNSVRTMARRPNVARAFTELNMAVMECHGDVSPEFKRLIGYVTSYVSGCRYCPAQLPRCPTVSLTNWLKSCTGTGRTMTSWKSWPSSRCSVI